MKYTFPAYYCLKQFYSRWSFITFCISLIYGVSYWTVNIVFQGYCWPRKISYYHNSILSGFNGYNAGLRCYKRKEFWKYKELDQEYWRKRQCWCWKDDSWKQMWFRGEKTGKNIPIHTEPSLAYMGYNLYMICFYFLVFCILKRQNSFRWNLAHE